MKYPIAATEYLVVLAESYWQPKLIT